VDTDTPLHDLRRGVKKYPQVLINVPVRDAKMLAERTEVSLAVEAVSRELGASGRVLVRASGTEPMIRVMVEGNNAGQVESLANQLADKVRELTSADAG
jgi:phosphoglucosamine mutase